MSHEHDWIEAFRASVYPAIHPYITRFGLYSTSHVGPDQYVATFTVSEEVIEELLLHRGNFERNPVAAYKTHTDGRKSTLSLRLTHEGDTSKREYVEPGMQLHLTFFPSKEGRKGTVDCYAHYEDDWAVSPWAHLRSKNFSSKEGVKRAHAYLRNATYLSQGNDYTIDINT